jgi:outer membrane protein
MKTKFTALALLFNFVFFIGVSAQNVKNLSIENMFDLVESENKLIRAQKSSEEITVEELKSAQKEKLPNISTYLSASYIGNAVLMNRHFGNAQGLSSSHFGNSFTIQAQQTIYAGGAINAGIKIAELQHKRTMLQTEMTLQELRFIALGQYLELYKIDNRIKVVDDNLSLTQKLIENIKEKYSQGISLKNDVTRYELQLQTLKLQLTQLNNNRNIQNHQLCNTLGLTETTIIPDSSTVMHTFPRDGEAAWQSLSITSSQAVRIADSNNVIAIQKLKLSKSELLPKVTFIATDDFNGPITYELPPINKNINTWYVGVGVSYQLSSLFKNRSKVKAAHIAARQADEEKAVIEETLNNQVQQAYTEYLQSYVEMETMQKNRELAVENYSVINKRYLSQLAIVTDMLDASNTKLDAELKVVDARINIAYTYYKLKYIAGKL